MTDLETRSVRATRVSIATAFGTWEEQPHIHAVQASEGCGQVIGEATLSMVCGMQWPAYRITDEVVHLGIPPEIGDITSTSYPTLTGKFVRIQVASEPWDGTWITIWYGIIAAQEFSPDGQDAPSGVLTYTCFGIAHMLDQIFIARGYEIASATASPDVIDPGYCPVFNERLIGNRAAATKALPGVSPAVSCYVHDRANTDDHWTAKDVVELLLAGFATPNLYTSTVQGTLRWSLASTTALGWRLPPMDLHGKTVFEALNAIINPARGLTWRIKITESPGQNPAAVVHVYPICPTSVTVGGTTIPAATLRSVVWTEDPRIESPVIREDDDFYDTIIVEGARPWVTITLWFEIGNTDSPLIPDGWDVDDDPAEGDPWTWHLFKLNPDWTGTQFDMASDGLRNVTTPLSNGDRYHNPTEKVPPVSVLDIGRDLPYGEGFVKVAEMQRERPIILIGTDAFGWQDLSDEQLLTPMPRGRLLIGQTEDDGFRLKTLLDGSYGDRMLVTVGVHEWAPLSVAWQRTTAAPRDVPRILIRREPDIEQWAVLNGTVYGIDPDDYKTLLKETSTTIITAGSVTALARIQGILAVMVARYGHRGGTASWRNRGTIDTSDALAPGNLISSIQDSGKIAVINATLTRRTWDFTEESFGTAYACDRLIVGLEAIA